MPGDRPMSPYFDWIKACRDLLGKPSGPNDGEDFLKMVNDVSWFGCFDDGMSPDEAVNEYKRKALD
jgi:hypothetical protein